MLINDILYEKIHRNISKLPDTVISALRKTIGAGAADKEKEWANAIELVNSAYNEHKIEIPTPSYRGAWADYEKFIAHAVRELSRNRGINGNWRSTNYEWRK